MKIPREIYNYLAYELSHYVQYKTLFASEPLLTGKMIITWKRHIEAIERAEENLKRRFPYFPAFFKVYFIDGEKNIEQVCELIHVSRETFYRYKREIIAELGVELGLLKR